MQTRIIDHFKLLSELPLQTMVTDAVHEVWYFPSAISRAMEMLKSASRVYVIGNGGSASIASHMAEDYTKNGGIPMMAFNDAAMLTCFANDLGYENVFSAAIQYYAQPDDLIIAISSSGRSQNIINGAAQAKAKGCNVITFSGFKDDNNLRKLGDLNFYVLSESYGNVEITHLSLLHAILDFICQDKK